MTTLKQPSIAVEFKQLASTAIVRGSKGRVGIIVFDDTDKTFNTATYKLSSEVEIAKFTVDNIQVIKDCFVGTPSQVTVIRVDTLQTIADALAIVSTLKLDWIGTASNIAADQTAIASYVKEQESQKNTIKAVVYNTTNSDCKHVVNLVNTNVVFSDERASRDGNEIVPTVLGLLAGLALNRSATYLQINNLLSVSPVADIDVEIAKGNLVLFNDEGIVKFSTAVNSLVTIDANNTELMCKIENIETMDLIYTDITRMFKNGYVGKFKNSVDRQYLLIAAINSYFEGLADDELLDKDYANKVFIDIDAQRIALKALKGDLVDTWSDDKVANTPVGTKIFLKADIKLLESIENFLFAISLF